MQCWIDCVVRTGIELLPTASFPRKHDRADGRIRCHEWRVAVRAGRGWDDQRCGHGYQANSSTSTGHAVTHVGNHSCVCER